MSNRNYGMNIDDATRRVMLAIAIGPRPIDLEYVAEDGTKPLVVTTPSEYLSAVIERVEAVGGSANVALADAKSFTFFTIKGIPRTPSNDKASEAMNNDMSMGMFWIKSQRKGGGKFRLKDGEASIPAVRQDFAYA